jgi:nucleoside-specific outer membrane channel protein Tsx
MNVRPLKPLVAVAALAALGTTALPAAAADWSDTSIGWRYGSSFAEPFVNNANGTRQDISKNIFSLTHASGFKYGTNFFNVDLLESNSKDPAGCANLFTTGCTGSAQEVYIVYRNVLDLAKITGKDMKFGVVNDVGVRWGVDWNAKTDAGYNSKKRMFVLGPNLMMDVPGFLNISVLALWESNQPCSTFPQPASGFPVANYPCVPRYSYKTHPALDLNWGIPIGSSGFSFEGFMDIIAKKGNNEFGGPTATETNFDGQIMYDVGAAMGGPKATFKVGFEFQYWKNKFGNPTTAIQAGFPGGAGAGPGATAKTPMIRAEYHF